MAHLIEIRDLKKIYAQGEEPVHALDGVSIDTPSSARTGSSPCA